MKIFVIIALAVAIGLVSVQAYLNSSTGIVASGGITFTVKDGWSATQIGVELEKVGAIKSSSYFKLYSRMHQLSGLYKAGSYFISPNLTTVQTAHLLIEGKTILYSVTIPEGRTLRQVATILENTGITSANEFITAASNKDTLGRYFITGPNAQGFLFPDTYLLQKPYPAEKVVELMVSTFYANLSKIVPDYQILAITELNEKVTMAGLVEKEYRVSDEAAIMAGVFYNRLALNMRLESCASVIYVLTEELGRAHPNRIFYSDLEVVSPYNVYKNYGLPPGPISNPGSVALRAAFSPVESNYLFFVVDDAVKGSHQFSTNLADHEQGRLAYINTFFNKQ